jgi:hypothetical protein
VLSILFFGENTHFYHKAVENSIKLLNKNILAYSLFSLIHKITIYLGPYCECPTLRVSVCLLSHYFRSLDGSIQNIQVDSQLAYSQSPVILYLSPTSKSDESRHMPAIHFTSHKTAGHSATTDNAEIFKHLVITIRLSG